jgi:hypothetical protein
MLVTYTKCKIEPYNKRASRKHKRLLGANSPSGDWRRGLFYKARKQPSSNERLNSTELWATGAIAGESWLHLTSSELITKRRKIVLKWMNTKGLDIEYRGSRTQRSHRIRNVTGSLYKNLREVYTKMARVYKAQCSSALVRSSPSRGSSHCHKQGSRDRVMVLWPSHVCWTNATVWFRFRKPR